MINLDADIHNADWTKRTWDLLDVEDEDDLMEHLSDTGMSLEHFKTLPVYKFNVNKLPWLAEL